MNLLMFNLAVDAEHVTLAFGLRWIEALASHFDHIDVITMYRGPYRLPGNVRVISVGRERGFPKWIRVLRFYWLAIKTIRQRRPSVVFAHMIPLFAVLFWPIARVAKLRTVLWYAHGATPPMLRLAHCLVDKVVSSTPEGFRIPSAKAVFVGQGIDGDRYRYTDRSASPIFRIITVGRLAPSKGQEKLLRALGQWELSPQTPWELTIVGDATCDAEMEYAISINAMATEMFPDGRVRFTGRLDPDDISRLLTSADLFVSLGTTGSLDKAIVEAMANGCPVISCNDAFRSIAEAEGFPECFFENDIGALQKAIYGFAAMPVEERRAIAVMQSRVATRHHTLDGLIKRLVGVLSDVAHEKGDLCA